ncbi:MAG TPA: DUF2127 domain-containing protein [Methylococcaceae bacterium]|nr:DUF2127 domain-containing protein [Candidatus Eisenbacteria bacterium]HUL13924.1 DUF2127 domain-containing protein [Methylococcaceae bacterium]
MTLLTRTILRTTFRTGITLKGIDGVLETIGGALLLLMHPAEVNAMLRVLCQHELSRDPQDFIAIHVLRASETLLGSNRLFASMYLLSHGVTKAALVVALWMNALWAYPLTIFVFAAFSVYQMYRYSHTHSMAMLLLTVFDVALIYLTWLEWQEQWALRANRIQRP